MSDEKIAPVTPAPDLRPSEDTRFVSHRVLVICVLLLTFFGFKAHHLGVREEEEVKFQARIEEVKSSIPQMMQLFEHREEASVENERFPGLIWRGSQSEVLHVTQRLEQIQQSPGRTVQAAMWDVFAKTQNGRFFVVTHQLKWGEDCTEEWRKRVGSCATWRGFKSLSPLAAKAYVHRLRDATLYERIFQEPMPAQEMPA